jgi:hypothetical protein
MAKVAIDFSEVPDFEAIPKGYYPAIVEEIVKKTNQAGDGEYLNWAFTLTGGEYDNRKQWAITSLKPTGLWKLREALEAFGLEMEQVELDIDDDTNMLISPELIGKACVLEVGQKIYQGKLRNQVESILPVDFDPNVKKANGTKGEQKSGRKFS